MNVIISMSDLKMSFFYYISDRHVKHIPPEEGRKEWDKFLSCLKETDTIIEERKPLRHLRTKENE